MSFPTAFDGTGPTRRELRALRRVRARRRLATGIASVTVAALLALGMPTTAFAEETPPLTDPATTSEATEATPTQEPAPSEPAPSESTPPSDDPAASDPPAEETPAESEPPAEETPDEPPDITPAVNSGSDNPTPPGGKTGSNVVLLRASDVSASSVAAPGVDASGNEVAYDPENALGPYASEDDARDWKRINEERAAKWKEEDEAWEGEEPDDE